MNENRVNLEGVLYDKDGSFMPLTGNNGNVDFDLANLRNAYMEAEREYFERLLAIPKIRNTFMAFMKEDAHALFNRALIIQENLENGNLETDDEKAKMKAMSPEEREEFHMKKLENAEGIMCLLLAAARDKAKILELVLTPSPDVDKSSGRSR